MLMVLRLIALVKGNFRKVSGNLTKLSIQLTWNGADRNTGRNSAISEGKSDVDQAKSRLWAPAAART